jgi:1-deoxy-D-xylulose-5-phosphate reductoisomerase
MNKKNIAILGSTGSIGENALRVVDSALNEFNVVVLSANGIKLTRLKEQCEFYKPKYLLLENHNAISEMQSEFSDITILHTSEGHDIIASETELDVVVVGTVGIAGLKSAFALAKATKIMAIANKEAILYGGDIMLQHLEKHNCKLIPVDSEHNSLYQLLRGVEISDVTKLIITASGGSFRDYSGDLSKVTVAQALSHPKWQMGHKNTIDSANLINKGIELIEAVILFKMEPKKIQAIIHPQVIIHAMIEMADNSVFAFLSNPDMSLHLANAMRDNNKKIETTPPIDFLKLGSLEFCEIDNKRFPGVKIAINAVETSRSHVVAFNSADEILVKAFIDEKIGFTQITDILEDILNKITPQKLESIEDIIDFDTEIKSITNNIITANA